MLSRDVMIVGATFLTKDKSGLALAEVTELLQGGGRELPSNTTILRFAQIARGTSVDNPESIYQVLVVGETPEQMETTIEVFEKYDGEPWMPDEATIRKVMARRAQLAVEAAERGEKVIETQDHYRDGRILNPDGTYTDYEVPESEKKWQNE